MPLTSEGERMLRASFQRREDEEACVPAMLHTDYLWFGPQVQDVNLKGPDLIDGRF